jgi:FkbM family methyltransferase
MKQALKALRDHHKAWRVLGLRSAVRFSLAGIQGAGRKDYVTNVGVDEVPFAICIRPHSTDVGVLWQIFGKKQYDLSRLGPYKTYLERICETIIAEGNVPLIIDAGANIGASTIWYALHFPRCQIYAVEPDPENFVLLKRNVENCANVTLFNAALWNEHTVLRLQNPKQGAWGRRFAPGTEGVAVPSITIPDLLNKDTNLHPMVLKVDIEGGETQLLKGDTGWVDDIPLIVFEVHDNQWNWLGPRQGGGHAFFSALSRRKREYLFHGANIFAFLHPNAPD